MSGMISVYYLHIRCLIFHGFQGIFRAVRRFDSGNLKRIKFSSSREL